MGAVEEEIIRTQAAAEGIPVAQFIRDAALARAVWGMARRQTDPGKAWEAICKLIEAAREDEDAIAAAREDSFHDLIEYLAG